MKNKSLTFSHTGFNSEPPVPISQIENTRGFLFLRLLREKYAWLSLLLNSLVNERAILTFGFYAQKLNCLLTVFSEQPLIRIVKEQSSLDDDVLMYYTRKESEFIPLAKDQGGFLRLIK